jgi:hypothetical protein
MSRHAVTASDLDALVEAVRRLDDCVERRLLALLEHSTHCRALGREIPESDSYSRRALAEAQATLVDRVRALLRQTGREV